MKNLIKILLLVSVVIFFSSCEFLNNLPITDDNSQEYAIGDIGPANGIIFYDCDADNLGDNPGLDGLSSKITGWRYLEAAPYNLELKNNLPSVGNENPFAAFSFGYQREQEDSNNLFVNGTNNFSPSNCTSRVIGKGKENTEKLVDLMKNEAYLFASGGTKNLIYAAKMCKELEYGGKSDWFLPSVEELKLMYTNLHKENLGNFGRSDVNAKYYWSSSEATFANYAGDAYFVNIIHFMDGNNYTHNRDVNNFVRSIRSF